MPKFYCCFQVNVNLRIYEILHIFTNLNFSSLAGTTFVDDIQTNEVGGTDYFIEVLVIADKSMVDYHGKGHIEKYLNTMMRIVSKITFFFLFVVVKIIVIKIRFLIKEKNL